MSAGGLTAANAVTARAVDGGADQAPAHVQLTTLGSMTFSFYDPSVLKDYPRESAEVAYAMAEALNNYNTVANYSGNVPVTFVTWGGLTAQASFQGSIQFGYSRSPRTAQHELAHWMGLAPGAWGSKGTWDGFCNGGWRGANGLARMAAFVPGAGIGCSPANGHFWDYGLNYNGEYHWLSMGRNVAMVGAMRSDFGLRDGSTLPDKVYRLVGKATALMVADRNQIDFGDAIETASTVSPRQAWTISFKGGYIQLRNLASQRYLDGSGSAPVLLSSPTSLDGTMWEMTPTTDGYFRLRNKYSNLCLKSAGAQAAGAPLQLGDCQGYWNPDAALQFHLATTALPDGLPGFDSLVALAPMSAPASRVVPAGGRVGLADVGDSPSSPALLNSGAGFYVRRGLADDQCISLESYDAPNSFVRASAGAVAVAASDGSSGFRADATFCPSPGLADSRAVTLRSYVDAQRVLRRMNSTLALGVVGADAQLDVDATIVLQGILK